MATTAITVIVDDIAITDQAVNDLGWDMESIDWERNSSAAKVRLVTTEVISCARMLADFWTEYADISEGY